MAKAPEQSKQPLDPDVGRNDGLRVVGSAFGTAICHVREAT